MSVSGSIPGPGKVFTLGEGIEVLTGGAKPPVSIRPDNHSVLALCVDRSGSMAGKETDVIGGINKFFADQRLIPGTADIIINRFDDQQHWITRNALSEQKDWTGKDYQPRGGTPLLDALGQVITLALGATAIRKTDDVIVVVITDGQENSSRQYSKAQIKALVETRTAQGWHFLYLGANVDAFAEAGAMGFAVNTTASTGASGQAVYASYSNASASVMDMRERKTSAGIDLQAQQVILEQQPIDPVSAAIIKKIEDDFQGADREG